MQSIKLFPLFAIHLLVYGVIAAYTAPTDWIAAIYAALLIWISIWDFLKFEIPDSAALLLVLTGLATLLKAPEIIFIDRLLGGILWPIVFWIVAELYLKVRDANGLGFGDVKLMAGIGLWCGAFGTIYVVLSSALAGLCVLSFLAVVHSTSISEIRQSKVAFGPFLCLSAWSVWLLGGTT